MIPLLASLHNSFCKFSIVLIKRGVLPLLLIACLLFTKNADAQVATYYNFTQSSGTYTPGTTGFIDTTGLASTTPASIFATAWDDVYAIFRLPFNFTYNGVLYSAGTGRIGLDSDGWFSFSNGNPDMTGSTGSGASWVSISDQTGVYFYGTAVTNGFAGFNCDLNEQTFATITGTTTNGSPTITSVSSVANIVIGTRLSAASGIPDGAIVTGFTANTITMSTNATANGSRTITPRSSIYAFVTGTAPNRQFIVQWTQAKRYSSSGENINLQMILNEGNANPILQTLQVIYGTNTATSASALETQVGLKGATTADFNARTSTSTWAATTAAAANTDHVRFSNTLNPASGLTFTWSPCTAPPAAPGSISGTSPVCAATTATYSLAAVSGATTYNWSYSGTGATFTTPTSSPSVTITFAAGATSGTLSVTAANLCGTNVTVSSLPITINPAPAASISYPASSYCISTSGTVAVNQTGTGGGTYTVNPAAGLTINGGNGTITPSTSTAGIYTVTYTFTNGTCSNTATTTVEIKALPSVTASASPAIVCNGINSQLLAAVSSGSGYTVTSIPYVSSAPSGSPTVLWNSYIDDGVSAAISLPFTFTYFGQSITQFYVSTNGYILLQTNTAVGAPAPQTLPDVTDPSNVVALAWEDLVVDPSSNPGAYVRYFTNGTSPNRVMIIEYNNLRFLGGSGAENVTGQIKLYESDNHIEVSAATVNDNGSGYSKTLGIENSTGTLGLAPAGRNNVAWNFTTPEAWSFNPVVANYSYLWTPSTYLSSTTISNPVAIAPASTTNYNVQVTNTTTGCVANVPVTVTVASPLNGTYTVGVGGNYTTLTAAVAAYNTLCIGGPVVFSLIDNTYPGETFPITINSNAYASSTNTLTIKPASGKTPVITGSSSVGIIKLNGADYVTIDGSNTAGGTTKDLSLINTSTNASTSTIVWLASVDASNGATNNAVKNCVFTGNASTTTFTQLISSGSSVGSVAEAANNNNSYTNNSFTKAQTAIAVVGPTGNETGVVISNNTIGSTTAANKMGWSGIELYQQANAQVTGNTVFGVTTNSSLIISSGISVFGTANGITISGNTINDVKHTNTGGYGANGIYLGSSSTAANVSVYNNFIWDIAGYGFNNYNYYDNGYGMVVDYGGGYKIYYNTVVLNTNQTATTNTRSAAILVSDFVTTASSVDLRNNIFGNTQTVGGANGRYAILVTAANTVFSNIDYNDYYSTGSTNLSCHGSNGTQTTTIAALRTSLGSNLNSINAVPNYVNAASDLHLQSVAGNSVVSNLATPVSGITTDYDNQTRNGLTPDMGADEFVMPNYGSWVGKTNTDWLVATNWEANYIPDGTTDVYITGGYTFMPTIITTQAVRDMNLSAPVPANTPILTLSAGTLQVNRNISRTGGSIDGSNGTLEMNGTVVQTIPASLFVNNNLKNLVIGNNNAAGVTIGGTLDIYRSVTFSGSGLKLTTGGFLTFKSTATETAWLGNMTGKTISGAATVERYISSGTSHLKSWQFLSAPTVGQTIKESWMENGLATSTPNGYGTWVTGSGAGFDAVSTTPSMKTYVPATGTWASVPNPSTTQINNVNGYMIFVRGDRSVYNFSGPNSTAVPTVLRSKGTLLTGTQASIPVGATQFGAVANPYPSAIDFSNNSGVIKSANVQSLFYLWDPKLGGNYGLGAYQTFTKGDDPDNNYYVSPGGGSFGAGGSVNNIIQSGQAFFVHTVGGTGTVQIGEAAKTSGSSLVMKPAGTSVTRQLRTNLYVMKDGEPVLIDGNLIQYNDAYSNNIDILDALKIENTGENLGIRSSGQLLAVERRAPIQKSDTVFYRIGQMKAQHYQFEFTAKDLDQPGIAAFLEDKYLSTSTVISLHDTTHVLFDIGNDPLSYAPDRFRIVFQKLSPTPVKFISIEAKRNPDQTVNVLWKVDNEINMQSYSVERSLNGIAFNSILSAQPLLNNGGRADYSANDQHPMTGDNFYRIKGLDINGMVQYSAIVKISSMKASAGITVYPNPVKDKRINVQLSGFIPGNYNVRLFNKLGQVVYQNTKQLNSPNASLDIQLDKGFSSGTYQLIITGINSKTYMQQLFIN